MTKKDYELIAVTFKIVQDSNEGWYTDSAMQAHKWMARALAETLQADNPKFNTDKFLAACGVAQ